MHPADHTAFGLYPPGAEMTRAAVLHNFREGERQMLFRISTACLLTTFC